MNEAVCANPVFIIGAHRSGTTALARAMALHSHFWASDETFFLWDLFADEKVEKLFDRLVQRPSASWLRAEHVDRDEFLSSLGLGLSALMTSRSGGRRWIDHTPHYGLFAETLQAVFPGARFVHILRDGRQVVDSMMKVGNTVETEEWEQLRRKGFVPKWADDFGKACREWFLHADAGARFCAAHPDRAIEIQHRDLEREPDIVLRRLFTFLDAPHDDAPAEFLASTRINSSTGTLGAGTRRLHPANPWGTWTDEQRRVFGEEASEALIRLGLATPDEFAEGYPGLVARTRVAVSAATPRGASVLIVNKGLPELVAIPERQVQPFPQNESGGYLGGHPVDSAAAIAGIESLKSKGARFLVIPQSSLWWLDHYVEFVKYLDEHASKVLVETGTGVIFELTPANSH